MMNKYLIILILIFQNLISTNAQPVSNDTLVCIIDTTHSYVVYEANPYSNRNTSFHWRINIKCHYYDIDRPNNKDDAFVSFNWDELHINNLYVSDFAGPYIEMVSKKRLNTNYMVVSDIWINKQTNGKILGKKIGWTPSDKYYFVIFKQDLEKANAEFVRMYRVHYWLNIVEE